MSILTLVFISIVLLFGLVLLFGAPYLPTRKEQVESALDVLNLKPGDTFIDLGSGDGRVVLSAAKKGLNAIGYEINPLLVLVSKLLLIGQRSKTKIIWGSFWQAKLPKAQGIFVFLRGEHMEKLNNKIVQYPHKPVKVASYAFQIPNRKYQKKLSGIYLYKYS